MARVAQPVEHFLGKEEVSGSSPDASSGRGPHRLTVRTPLFQGGDRGSIPREGVAAAKEALRKGATKRRYAAALRRGGSKRRCETASEKALRNGGRRARGAASSAGIAQLVERHVANVKVAGSNPVSRSEPCQQKAHERRLVGFCMFRFRDVGPVAKW